MHNTHTHTDSVITRAPLPNLSTEIEHQQIDAAERERAVGRARPVTAIKSHTYTMHMHTRSHISHTHHVPQRDAEARLARQLGERYVDLEPLVPESQSGASHRP
jgi:hypothetical protein